MTLTGLTNDTSTLWRPADLEAIRASYRAERDKRLRPEGPTQYVNTDQAISPVSADPWSERAEREPVHDDVDAVVGAGFGGLVAASYLRKAGVQPDPARRRRGRRGRHLVLEPLPGHGLRHRVLHLPPLAGGGRRDAEPQVRARGDEIRRHASGSPSTSTCTATRCSTPRSRLPLGRRRSRWRVGTDRGDAFTARYAVVSSGRSTGRSCRASPASRRSAGHMFHTSRWDYDYTGGSTTAGLVPGLAGKRVAVIGTGATAIQVVPDHRRATRGELLSCSAPRPAVDRRDDRDHRRRSGGHVAGTGLAAPTAGRTSSRWSGRGSRRGEPRRRQVDRHRPGPRRDRRLHVRDRRGPGLALELADHQKMDRDAGPGRRDRRGPRHRGRTAALVPADVQAPAFSDRYLQAFNRDNVS